MKKGIVSLVVAGSLIVGNPLASSAQGSENYNSTKIVYQDHDVVNFSGNNGNNWNDWIENFINNFYNQYEQKQQTMQPGQPKQEQTVKQPKQQQPVQQQPTQQPAEEAPEQPVSAYTVSQFEQQVISLTNNERAKYGLQPLKLDEELSRVARTKSNDMKQNGYFSHTSPTYGSPFDMMKKFGIQYRAAGENIAKGQRSPEEVVNAWMNSEGHRKNILSSNFTHIGVGHVSGNYWTQMFVGR
jgi:uncharacterized YkwD family protein